MSKQSSIQAGRAYAKLFADNSKLVRGLRAASAKLKAFGAAVKGLCMWCNVRRDKRRIGLLLAGAPRIDDSQEMTCENHHLRRFAWIIQW